MRVLFGSFFSCLQGFVIGKLKYLYFKNLSIDSILLPFKYDFKYVEDEKTNIRSLHVKNLSN